jgi:hypothetical protein
MDTIQIFKKSLGLVWRYRALWLFGALLALTVSNALWLGFAPNRENVVMQNKIIFLVSTVYFPGQGVTIDFRGLDGPVVRIEGLEPVWIQDLSKAVSLSDVWALLISIGVLVLISALLAILFRYTSQAALIRMVDENERSGKMVSVRRGLRLGWSRAAGKLFLIDLMITLPLILVFGLLFFLATSPLFLLGVESLAKSLVTVLGISLLTLAGLFLFTILVVATAFVLSITRPVMRQACAVEGLGVGASIRQGLSLLKTRFDKVFVTWLVWLAVRVVWTVAIIPAMIILSPVLLLAMLAGIVIGAIPALLAAGIASLFVNTAFAWIIGVIFGLPLFVLVTFSPIIFLSGLVEVFKSSFWTLSYREFRPLASTAAQPAGKPGPVDLKAALAQQI